MAKTENFLRYLFGFSETQQYFRNGEYIKSSLALIAEAAPYAAVLLAPVTLVPVAVAALAKVYYEHEASKRRSKTRSWHRTAMK